MTTIINIYNVIRLCKDQYKFQGKCNSIGVMSSANLVGNKTSLHRFISIKDFELIKAFKVKINHPKTYLIGEVFWHLHFLNGSNAIQMVQPPNNTELAASGGIFKDKDENFLGGCTVNNEIDIALNT